MRNDSSKYFKKNDRTYIMNLPDDRLVELVLALVTAGLAEEKALSYISRTYKIDLERLTKLVRQV